MIRPVVSALTALLTAAQVQDAARYDELGQGWAVDPSYVLQMHRQHRGTAASDDIAWFFVENGLFGECEGDVPCYMRWQNELNGTYLRLHPRGRHADESTADVAFRLNAAMDNLRRFPSVLAEFRTHDAMRRTP